MAEKTFANGLIFKAPRESAPEYVKGSLSVKVDEFVEFLNEHVTPSGWVNIDIKESKGGKLYCELNTWTPKGKKEEKEEPQEATAGPDGIPF